MYPSPLLLMITLFALAKTVMADLTITSPNATSFVTAGSTLPITWTYTGAMPPSPATISVELVDNSKKLFTGPLALISNVLTSSGDASWMIPKLGFVGSSFSVILVANINSQATIFAQGLAFAILPEGTTSNTSSVAQVANGQSSASTTTSWSLAGQAVVGSAATLLLLTQL